MCCFRAHETSWQRRSSCWIGSLRRRTLSQSGSNTITAETWQNAYAECQKKRCAKWGYFFLLNLPGLWRIRFQVTCSKKNFGVTPWVYFEEWNDEPKGSKGTKGVQCVCSVHQASLAVCSLITSWTTDTEWPAQESSRPVFSLLWEVWSTRDLGRKKPSDFDQKTRLMLTWKHWISAKPLC